MDTEWIIPIVAAGGALPLAVGLYPLARGRSRTYRGWVALGLLLLAAAVALEVAAGHLRSYRRLPADEPLAVFHFTRQAPADYVLRIEYAGGDEAYYDIAAEAWRVELRTLDWAGPARWIGLAPMYRLDSLHTPGNPRPLSLAPADGLLDLWSLVRERLPWFTWIRPAVARGPELPAVDGGRYRLSLHLPGELQVQLEGNESDTGRE